MDATNTKGKFMIGLAPTSLIADLSTNWTVAMQCGTQPPQSLPQGGIWIMSLATPVVPGDPLVGSSSLGINTSWNLVPQ
jgi:hypothetical protein